LIHLQSKRDAIDDAIKKAVGRVRYLTTDNSRRKQELETLDDEIKKRQRELSSIDNDLKEMIRTRGEPDILKNNTQFQTVYEYCKKQEDEMIARIKTLMEQHASLIRTKNTK